MFVWDKDEFGNWYPVEEQDVQGVEPERQAA